VALVRRPFLLDRLVAAVDQVLDRLQRATIALEEAGINYAVAGGNAVALWVATVDDGAVRNTRNVDIMIARRDLAAVRATLAGAGFIHRTVGGLDVFVDGPEGRVADGVRVIFANEMVRSDEAMANPGMDESVESDGFRVLALEPLVRTKLTAFRDRDRTHLRDLIEVGLIDETWCAKLPAELAFRLQQLLDTPEG
jgi:hypothetical protein